MGFARKPGYGYLVYELLEGGDLRKMLNTAAQDAQEGRPSSFPWDKRLSALIDTACGLSHLHNMTPKAFHRDIKSANVLETQLQSWKHGWIGLAQISFACASSMKYDQNFHFLQLSLYALVIPTQILNISPQFSNFLVSAATDEELKLIENGMKPDPS